MALYNYFTKIGTIDYNGSIVNNIITSVRFKEVTRKLAAIYYPYVVKEGERPDNIAANYYDDERYAWIVYLSNTIVDPYFEWPLSQNELNKFLLAKYGSVQIANERIVFFRNNFNVDETILSVSAYEALTSNLKKYWNPNINFSGSTVSYSRRPDTDVIETNKTVSLALTTSTGFTLNEKVTQRTSGVITAGGQIKHISNTAIILQHIEGAFANTGGSVGAVVGSESGTSKSVSNVVTLNTSIPATETVYWTPVTAYDYEVELNDAKRNIQLLDKQYVNSVEDQMLELLS